VSRVRSTTTDRRQADDSGFTLIEVIVSLSLIAIISTAVLLFYIRSMQTTSHLQRSQSADSVAMDVMEEVRSVSALAPSGGVSGVLAGRAPAAVAAQWSAAAAVDTAGSIAQSDPSPAGPPTVPLQQDFLRDGITYHVSTLIGKCYRVASFTGADTPCDTTSVTGVPILRVVVVVTWNPTSAGQCGGAALCTYRTQSLIDPTADATWNLTSKPVAYDDAGTLTALSPAQDFAVVANDVLGSVSSNPIFGITGNTMGTAQAGTETSAPWMLRYTPSGTASGIETFTYKLRDGAGRVSNAATVTFNVNPVADTFGGVQVVKGTSTAIALATHIHGTFAPSAAVTITTAPSVGSISGSSGTTLTYVAPSTSNPATSTNFSYKVTDNSGLTSNVGTVTLTLKSPTPTTPTAAPFTSNIAASLLATPPTYALNVAAQAGVTGFDAGSTVVVSSALPAGQGTVSGSGTADLSYQPPTNKAGRFTFTYYVVNSVGVRSTAPDSVVTLVVTPSAVDDTYSIKKSTTKTKNVAGNDTPSSGMIYAITGGATTTCGTATINSSTGIVSFSASNKETTCTVTYSITAPTGTPAPFDTGTLTVTVTE